MAASAPSWVSGWPAVCSFASAAIDFAAGEARARGARIVAGVAADEVVVLVFLEHRQHLLCLGQSPGVDQQADEMMVGRLDGATKAFCVVTSVVLRWLRTLCSVLTACLP